MRNLWPVRNPGLRPGVDSPTRAPAPRRIPRGRRSCHTGPVCFAAPAGPALPHLSPVKAPVAQPLVAALLLAMAGPAQASLETGVALCAVTFSLPPGPEVAGPPIAETAPPAAQTPRIPFYDFWLRRIAARPRPESAEAFLPSLHAAFAAEGVPPELVWLAETESSFNPRARSQAGARGLFQLMPETARSLGLDLLPDERVHPARSARAAAAYLRHLHGRFGDWPLALAAYNAGESRVARELKRRGAADFAAIARHLPAETRLYVPKVLATVRLRSGVAPENLAAPVPRDS